MTAACSTVKVPADTTSASAGARAAARILIEEALTAKGGKARLMGLKSLRLIAVGTTTIEGKSLRCEVARMFVFPDKMRIDATITRPGAPAVVVSVGMSGEIGWQRTPDLKANDDVSVDVTGGTLQTLRFERWRDPELILLRALDPAAAVVLVPDDTVAGGDLYSVVRLRSPFGAVDVFLYINKKTKLLARMIYSDGSNTESDDFDDYRDVAGLQFAYKRTSKSGGRSTALELKTVEVDPEIDMTLFDKPATKVSIDWSRPLQRR